MNNDKPKNNDIVIWGTRASGNVAYYYYKSRSNIICYIDNDERKWGETLNGIEICSPDMLKKVKAKVILTMQRGIEDVKKQLLEEYGINQYLLFQLKEEIHLEEKKASAKDEIPENTCIICFSGGLRNQMFQYAFLRNLEVRGKNILIDLKKYEQVGVMNFSLTDVFKNIVLKECTKEQRVKLIEANAAENNQAKKFVIYTESLYMKDRVKNADLSLLDISAGIITGMHQTYKFAAQIRDILLTDFQFQSESEEALMTLHASMKADNAVSVHIRRGDYLLEQNKWFYGGICTEQYYEDAIQYIKERDGQCKFYFFSDDIEWVKEHYVMDNVVYIERALFGNYKDWYDMYLMSICKHNIIANSTFSWWGAWLNQNKEKIVIAPKKWIQVFDYEDIYPEEWITM